MESQSLLGDLRLTLYALSLEPGDALATQPEGSRRANELALSFGDALVAALEQLPNEFTERQIHVLNILAGSLRDMSGGESAVLWTEEAVYSHPKWKEVRSRARDALRELGWERLDA